MFESPLYILAIFTLVVVMVIAIWQLRSVRRKRLQRERDALAGNRRDGRGSI